MEDAVSAKPGFDHFVDWCKAEVAKLKEELTALEEGTVRMGKRVANGDWEDITPKHSAWLKQKIVELDDLIITYSFPI
jgi:hypothetical protein